MQKRMKKWEFVLLGGDQMAAMTDGCIWLSEGTQSVRSSPQKKRATVPGPVWLPIVAPIG